MDYENIATVISAQLRIEAHRVRERAAKAEKMADAIRLRPNDQDVLDYVGTLAHYLGVPTIRWRWDQDSIHPKHKTP